MFKQLMSWKQAYERGLCRWCGEAWIPHHVCTVGPAPPVKKCEPGDAEGCDDLQKWSAQRGGSAQRRARSPSGS
jgi:hypothetical protein